MLNENEELFNVNTRRETNHPPKVSSYATDSIMMFSKYSPSGIVIPSKISDSCSSLNCSTIVSKYIGKIFSISFILVVDVTWNKLAKELPIVES